MLIITRLWVRLSSLCHFKGYWYRFSAILTSKTGFLQTVFVAVFISWAPVVDYLGDRYAV